MIFQTRTQLNCSSDAESSADDAELPDLSSDDDVIWGREEDDSEPDLEVDDMSDNDDAGDSEDSADSEDGSGSSSDDFATSMAKITGNLSRNVFNTPIWHVNLMGNGE